MNQAHASWPGTIIPIAIIAIVFVLRLRGMRNARRLRLETLWILPAIYVAVVAAMFVEFPPSPRGWLWCALALAAGAALGWQRGRLMRISIDPDTHRLSQQGSPAALILLVALVLGRQLVRYEFSQAGRVALIATGIALSFGVGLVVATRLEMGLRARRMLMAARAGAEARS